MGHVCICGLLDSEHDPYCVYDDHDHQMAPLCCPECPCLSYEQVHPELFGTLVAGRVDARTKNRLAKWGILTMERLDRLYYSVAASKGVGPKTRRDMYSALYHWRIEVEEGAAVRRPLPEDLELGQFRFPEVAR